MRFTSIICDDCTMLSSDLTGAVAVTVVVVVAAPDNAADDDDVVDVIE